MEKYITDERTELRYELSGGIYYLAGDDQPEEEKSEPNGGLRRWKNTSNAVFESFYLCRE